jgi:hypothetical protein
MIKTYKIMLPAVLYGCKISSISLSLSGRKEHKLRVSEKRVLKQIFGPKTMEVGGS